MTPLTEATPGGSLRARMLLSASLVLVVFLGVMGFVLDNAYRLSARQSESERLQLHVYALIAATMEDDEAGAGSLYLPDELREPHFNSPGAGLYGLVFNADGIEIWRSRSALGLMLSAAEKEQLLAMQTPGVITFSELPEVREREPLFYLTYPIIWQSAGGEAGYTYVAMQNFKPYRHEVAAFRNNLWGWLVAGLVLLVGLQAAIMYWGLLPIAGLRRDLKAIEEGDRDYLVGRYPKEIAGVTRSLNLLLSEERGQRERYRAMLTDLAHSLKTPLAILKAEADKPNPSVSAITASLDEQVNRMNEIVSYQLERAVAPSSSLVKSSVEVAPALEKLVSAIRQVYADKQVSIEDRVEAVTFPGDERDLLELLGNLLDNACKYGRRRVRLFAGIVSGSLQFTVEDDGPGIDREYRDRVLERGARLDTRVSGQGIGLAVVAEIVDRYKGMLDIGASHLGGARVIVTFDI